MAKFIQAKDLRGKRTEKLIDAVPLPAPWTMFIDCGNPCNARCTYCPTGDTELLRKIGRKNVLMPWELFTKVVDDMKVFPRKLKRVNSYKDGEPLIHPRFTDMMRYLKDADVTEAL